MWQNDYADFQNKEEVRLMLQLGITGKSCVESPIVPLHALSYLERPIQCHIEDLFI